VHEVSGFSLRWGVQEEGESLFGLRQGIERLSPVHDGMAFSSHRGFSFPSLDYSSSRRWRFLGGVGEDRGSLSEGVRVSAAALLYHLPRESSIRSSVPSPFPTHHH